MAPRSPPEKQDVLKEFARSGGTLLTPAAGGPPKPRAETAITLDKAELERIGDLWHDVQALIGRRNLGRCGCSMCQVCFRACWPRPVAGRWRCTS